MQNVAYWHCIAYLCHCESKVSGLFQNPKFTVQIAHDQILEKSLMYCNAYNDMFNLEMVMSSTELSL